MSHLAPLFAPLEGRWAGVLLHPTSLPGPTGTGTLGAWARKWVDFLAAAGVTYWQMLPVGPVADDGSPYRSFSSCAGNPYLIDLLELVERGLLQEKDLTALNNLGVTKVDFAVQHGLRFGVLTKAWENWRKLKEKKESKEIKILEKNYGSFEAFRKNHKEWLRPWALFMALKEENGGAMWRHWPVEQRKSGEMLKKRLSGERAERVEREEFWQYLFYGQWWNLKKYATERGVRLIGDVPFYVPEDSVDVWSAPEMFLLDEAGVPTSVGGCPPDYFDPKGQRWGNPIYNWAEHKRTHYAWWRQRMGHTFQMFDMVRIDHFRAFYDFWKIPAESETAMVGEWVLGPGLEFFKELKKELPHAKMIAEDMGGDLHQGVKDLLRDTGLPGITVLQFAFGGDAHNPYLPHNAKLNQVAYTGTHDNNTLVGWIDQAMDHELAHALNYLNAHKGTLVEASVKAVLSGVPALAVLPVQDLLGLGAWARMNVPGVALGNWQWRLSEEEFGRLNADWLHTLLREYGRA